MCTDVVSEAHVSRKMFNKEEEDGRVIQANCPIPFIPESFCLYQGS